MKKVVVLIMISLFFGCNKKEDQKTSIISKYKMPPPSPEFFTYGNNVFIIDKKSQIYYYQRGSVRFICKGTSNEFDYNQIPEFIDLRPENIIQIPNKGISDFVKLNLKFNVKNIINISSQNNIFNSKTYFNLIAAVESSCYRQDRDSYKIRKTTQEEDSVLKYKISNKYYSAKNIKWDKSRIKFTEQVKFVKPPTKN